MWRRAKRIGLLLIAVTFLLAAGALILIQTSVFQQWLLRQAERIAEEAGHPFTARKLDVDIWRLRVSLEAIRYDDNKGTRVAIDRFLAGIPWDGFRGNIIRIRNLEADGVSIEIRSGEPVVPAPSRGTTEAPRILFEQLAIRNGSLTYSDQNTTFRIPAFDLEAQAGRGVLRLSSPMTISPDLRFSLPELALQISDQSVDFGPSAWRIEHRDVTVNGSSHGSLRWSPSLAVSMDYSVDPFSYQQWRGLESSGAVAYKDGVLKVTNFRAKSGGGQLTGTAEVSDESRSATIFWSAVNLAPAGFPAVTDGKLQLQWKASDFSDVSGKGSIVVNSRQYGRAQSDVTIQDARAKLNIRANAFDAAVEASVTTGFDQKISGTFQATHTKYGKVRLAGSLGGSFNDPRADAMLMADNVAYGGFGPASASAHAALKSRIVSIDDIRVQMKNSSAARGFLVVNLDNQQIAGEIPEMQVQLGDFNPNVAGNLTLSAVVEGTITSPAARIAGSSQGLDAGGTHIDSAEFTGELTAGEFHLIELTARQGEGVLNASGNYNFTTEAIAGKTQISDLRLVQVPELSATVSLDVNVQGTVRSPSVDFNGRLRDLVYRGQEHGSLDLRGTANDDRISVSVQSEKYTAAAAAQIRLQEPYAFSASVTANRSRVQYQQYDITANGTVEGSGQMHPFKAEQLSFNDFTIAGQGVDLRASGALSNGASVAGTIELAELPLEGVEINGQARVQAVVSGSIEDPRVEGTIETSGASVQTSGMAEPARIEAAVDFTRNEYTLRRLRALFQEATADVTGHGTLQGTGQFEFRADNIKPEQFLKDRPVAGVVQLEGQVDVTGPSLDGISGSAKVTALELNVKDVAIHQVQPIEIAFQNQVASIRNFNIEGLQTRITISGNTNLRTRELNFTIDANTDMRLLETALPGSRAQGQVRTNITVRGTPEQPSLEGFLNGARMQLQIADPPMLITDTNVEIQLRGDRIQITSARGSINGGEFTASGGTGISSAGISDAGIQLNLMRAQTEYPEGFQSEISSQLALSGSGNNLEITGNVDVLNGVYQRDIDLTQEVFSRISAQAGERSLAFSGERSAIDDIRLNITAGTPGVVSVTNNLANFDVEGSFRLRGTLGNPIITGRAMVAEGGELYFGPRIGRAASTELERGDRYVISEGTIDLNNPIRTEPVFNIVATREITAKDKDGADQRYIITLHASGTPEKPKTELTSDPALSEPEIVSLLLTGRSLDQLLSQGSQASQGSQTATAASRNPTLGLAQEQFANYISGRFSGVFNTAGSTFGVDTVQIDPVMVAKEAGENLSAKLTVGKNVTRDLGLIYSQNLSGPRAQTWIASYQAIKDLLVRGVNRSEDNTFTVELRHDLKWGGGPSPPRGRARRQDEEILGEVTFDGSSVPAKDLLKRVTRTGRPFSTYRMNDDVRRLRQFFAGRSFLDAKVRAERNPRDGKVSVRFIIEEGPKITFAFEGARTPKNIQQDIRQIWIRGFAEDTSLRNSEQRLLRYFRDEGYLQAMVSSRNESPSPMNRRFVFDISLGSRFQTPAWAFQGIEAIDLGVRAGTAMESPRAIQRLIENELQKEGYLDAASTEPQLVIEGAKSRFEVTVERGPRYSLGKIDFEGARPDIAPAISEAVIAGAASNGAPQRDFFTSSWLDTTRQAIVGKYWENGFNDVQVEAETHTREGEAIVDVQFKIAEGERQVINEIRIEGNKSTDLRYIRRQFTFNEGDPVDYSRVNLTRKNLYDTRLFRRVDLNVVKENNGYAAETKLNENPPWNFRYGFAVTNQLQTSDRELGVTTDFSYSNLLGKAITTGVSMKYTREEREARTFGSIPVFAGRNATTTATLFRRREFHADADPLNPTVITDLWGFTVQQQWRLRNRYILSYDYSYKRNRTFDKNLDPNDPFAFDITIPIARFNGTLTRDTRDDILNASRGTLLSNSFEVAPPGVGSSIKFLKNYTQYFRFRPVKQRLVWASAVRAGFAQGFGGQDLIPSEKFRAGGGTTVRAFQQDQLTSLSGNALFVVNQELRFPLLWRFSGVMFFDAGNVYSTARDFNPFRLRYSPGIGIRIETPLVLVRFDLGLNLFRRFGEPRSRLSFGVGQAF